MTPSLHGLYAIIDLDQTDQPVELLRAVVQGGARAVQLRAKGRDKGPLLPLAEQMATVCRGAEVPFLVNDHVDLAIASQADGAHVGQTDLPVAAARALLGPDRVLGCSTNTVEEAVAAIAAGADYLGVGAMFPTTTKGDTRPAGPPRLAAIRASVNAPIVAIGGITVANAAEVIALGADMVAVVSALARAEDPRREAAAFAALFPSAAPTRRPTIDAIVEDCRARFVAKNRARELGLQAQREIIRLSANSIRATHRAEFALASELLSRAEATFRAAVAAMRGHDDVRYAGFLQDAEKEYAEAALTLAIVAGRPLPTPQQLSVSDTPYLNGLGEVVGELRREILDILRRGAIGDSERLLAVMDDICTQLATVDYPDALTGGLRRTTDAARAIVERTRGDLTLALQQARLEARLARLEGPERAM